MIPFQKDGSPVLKKNIFGCRKFTFQREVERIYNCKFSKVKARGAWLAQSAQHVTLYLQVVGLSPMLSVEITLKKDSQKEVYLKFSQVKGNVRAILVSPHFTQLSENLNIVFLKFYFPTAGVIQSPIYLPPVVPWFQAPRAKVDSSEYQLSTTQFMADCSTMLISTAPCKTCSYPMLLCHIQGMGILLINGP